MDIVRLEKELILELFKSKPWFRGIGISPTEQKGTYKLSLRVKFGKEKEAQKELDNLQLESIIEVIGVGEMKAY